jgi:hypothetical protein
MLPKQKLAATIAAELGLSPEEIATVQVTVQDVDDRTVSYVVGDVDDELLAQSGAGTLAYLASLADDDRAEFFDRLDEKLRGKPSHPAPSTRPFLADDRTEG